MRSDYPLFEMIMAISVFCLFGISAIALLVMMVHILYKTIKKLQKKKTPERRQLAFFLVVTFVAILSFEISLCLIFAVSLETFLEDNKIKQSTFSMLDDHSMFVVYQYCIGIFDSIGHLLMLLLFIGRFHYTFKNAIFGRSKYLIRCMYTVLVALFFVALFLICYMMPTEADRDHLMLLEIAWELSVESMILFILYLFVSHLYHLLKLSLLSHLKGDKTKANLISEITKISLETSRSTKVRNLKAPSNGKSKLTMTIDGHIVDPSVNNKSVQKSAGYKSETENMTDHETDAENGPGEQQSSGQSGNGYSQTIDILRVMSKMTLVVILAGIGSLFTILGNVVIESFGVYNEKAIGDSTGMDHDMLWVYVLPVIDMVITSLMMYLQFNFTHRVYNIMCHCLDKLFLKCMLAIIVQCWGTDDEQEKTASFIMENDLRQMQQQSKERDLETKSTVSDAEVNIAVKI